MENNPYQAPEGDLTPESQAQTDVLHEPRSVSVGNGMNWIGDGFNHFKQDAGTWIGICVVGFIIMMVLGLIPFVNMIANLTAYVWAGGLLLGCKASL